MSPVFLAFLVLLGAFVLISLAAAARIMWLRFRPSGTAALPSELSPRHPKAADALLLIATALAWYSVAGGWAAQLVIYPIYSDMSAFGPQAFHGFSHGYLSRFALGVLPIGVMCVAWALLLWFPCRNVPAGIVWSIIALCVAFVAVTPPAAGAQSHMYHEGFSNDMFDRLLWWNGGRSIIFTLIGFLSLAAVRRRWTFHDSPRA
jgi:hypothetical protein